MKQSEACHSETDIWHSLVFQRGSQAVNNFSNTAGIVQGLRDRADSTTPATSSQAIPGLAHTLFPFRSKHEKDPACFTSYASPAGT